jgi:hypothetical protein
VRVPTKKVRKRTRQKEVLRFPTIKAEIFHVQAAQKRSYARRAKSDERRRTLVYVDAKSDERNEADGRFSAACALYD